MPEIGEDVIGRRAGPRLPSPGGGGSARIARCETGWGDLSTRALFETRDCHPTPPLISFASTLPLQGRVKISSRASDAASLASPASPTLYQASAATRRPAYGG